MINLLGGLLLKRTIWSSLILFFLISSFISGCSNSIPVASASGGNSIAASMASSTQKVVASATPTKNIPASLWLDPTLPGVLQEEIKTQNGYQLADTRESADLSLALAPNPSSVDNVIGQVQWVYALVAPFPTVTDATLSSDLKNFWLGNSVANAPLQKLLVSDETVAVFNALWGTSSSANVETVSKDQLATNDFKAPGTWAIVPFDELTPRWKVIKIDGLSPLDKPLDTSAYALKADFVLSSSIQDTNLQAVGKTILSSLPLTNRDESKMTVLMMTGTTALVRAIAYKMEIKGLDYPIEKVKDWFANADLIHVSNEVSFDPTCPYPDYNQHGLQFCSSPRYLKTLQDLGVNVVELTGNHENDYGSQYLESTIDTYNNLGWSVFGGGKTEAEAQAPVKVEANGNKIAFIGCNPAGPTSDWATGVKAGSAPCDMKYFTQQISDLKSQGYVVIATFQQDEIYNSYSYGDQLAQVFRDSANAGADIVSGSEAHYAMGFQFIGNSLIHFGLGNFLFDQMAVQGVPDDNIRREFIDRHIIYNGKYMSTELLTAELVDWAQPTPMTDQQRTAFLTDVFNGSFWSKKQ